MLLQNAVPQLDNDRIAEECKKPQRRWPQHLTAGQVCAAGTGVSLNLHRRCGATWPALRWQLLLLADL